MGALAAKKSRLRQWRKDFNVVNDSWIYRGEIISEGDASHRLRPEAVLVFRIDRDSLGEQ